VAGRCLPRRHLLGYSVNRGTSPRPDAKFSRVKTVVGDVSCLLMNSQGEQPEQATRQSLAQTLPAAMAAYLGSLAIIAYPLGLFTLWTQIWRFHTHDSFTAMYAASLIPLPAATSKALGVLDLLLYTGLGAGLIFVFFVQSETLRQSNILHHHISRAEYRRVSRRVLRRVASTDEGLDINKVLGGHETWFSFLRSAFRPDDKLVFGMFFCASLQAALVPLMFGHEMFGRSIPTSFLDIYLYAWYLVFVCLGGTWGAFLIYRRPRGRGDLIAGYTVLYAGALLAAMALIPLQQPSLPVAEFSEDTVNEAILISHQEGYWYVIQEDQRSLTAIPDDEAGRVSISGVLGQ